MQAFVDDSFRDIVQTESAVDLLRQFEAILQRDSLKVRCRWPLPLPCMCVCEGRRAHACGRVRACKHVSCLRACAPFVLA